MKSARITAKVARLPRAPARVILGLLETAIFHLQTVLSWEHRRQKFITRFVLDVFTLSVVTPKYRYNFANMLDADGTRFCIGGSLGGSGIGVNKRMQASVLAVR